MILDIIFQISVFGDFSSITPNETSIKTMTENFKDYGLLASVFQENNFNISPDPKLSKIETAARLSMVSIEKKLNVMFAGGRMDISKASSDLTAPLTGDDLKILLDILSKASLGQLFTRVAFNTTAILNNPSENVMKKLQTNLSFYSDLNELTLRLNKRTELAISENITETSNSIITIQKTAGQLLLNNQPIPVENGLIIQFDINSLAENPNARFSTEQAKKFISSAEEIRQTILSQLAS